MSNGNRNKEHESWFPVGSLPVYVGRVGMGQIRVQYDIGGREWSLWRRIESFFFFLN